ncbi:glycoside hydrolase family 2 TIM barrel-domain containing protein [Parasediminibacterium sp. JCM 36343]|uniref:glycoside hydrolase family 2 TIM barrel-domain containing protein n=1 Tax=Parasediminibacterium sp. JCM 36343 TaxID=3374279 RepID=UPI00397964DE
MKKIFVVVFACIFFQTTFAQSVGSHLPFALPTKSIRKEISLNGLWDFTSNKAKQTTQIRVPGAYTNVWDGKWGKPYWDVFNYPREWKGGAIYKKDLVLDANLQKKNLRLHVDGCWQNYSVLFDGNIFDTIHDGYSARNFDLGKNLSIGSHSLKIRIEEEETRLSGGESMKSKGIWDDISLQVLPDIFVEQGLVIRTSFTDKNISCDVPINNTTDDNQTFIIKYFITDATGKVVKTIDGGEQTLPAKTSKTFAVNEAWAYAHLWFPHDPYLYHFNTVLYKKDGTAIDWHKERFGFREISWAGPNLFINGRKLFLRGHGEHYLGDVQASRAYFVTWFTELKKMGVNFMRLHIYPRHKVLYEVADELGFLLEAEPAFHFKVPTDQTFAKQHLGDMMKNLINHPSIFTWSVSNELRWQGGGEKPWLIDHAHSIDKTRPAFASDFSAFSTHGDIIGHHYNTDSVFKEWEQFGANKPMVWDECGEVWQPNRPLGNGTAGYEVIAQDYATGIYRDGQNEIKAAFDLVREGKTFAGSLHRINALSPWDFGCVFFRWQPYNRYRGIAPAYKTLEGPGVKPKQILPCATPVNIWDPTLPVYEPNPGYYLFAEDMKWVRFPYDSKNFSFFGGENASIKTPLLQYDDLRFVDEIHCKIETPEGKVLSETIKKQSLQPGDMLRDVEWHFNIPSISTETHIHIVREFWYKGKAGYKDVREGHIYPRLSASLLHLNGKKIGVIDEDGGLIKVLTDAGIPFKKLLGMSNPADANIVLVVGNKLPDYAKTQAYQGLTLIQFMNDNGLLKGSARLFANGANYKVLDGIGQEELSFWKGGNEYGGMEKPSVSENSRVLITGDKDGKTSALHQIYTGKGCAWVTSLKLTETAKLEPVAGWLLHNLIDNSANYKPIIKTNEAAVYGQTDFVVWMNKTAKPISAVNAASIKDFKVLFLDARTNALTDEEVKTIKSFEDNGGRVCIYQITNKTIDSYKKLIGDSLTLTKPFLDEKAGCVKAATSWTLRSTPKTGVEYYDSVVVPQPFEPNYDPFLSGLSNITLNWNGKAMFQNGVKMKGISPVSVNDSFRILVSNWRNDWSVPPFGAEYINEGKDMRQAMWYLNRDPVLASIKQGKGEYMLCQLDLINGGEKGLTIANQILTNWECSVGGTTFFPDKKDVFDFTAAADQKLRMTKVETEIAKLQPLDSLPSVLYDMGGSSDGKQRKILLLTDSRMLAVAPEIIKKLTGFGSVSYSGVSVNNPKAFNNNVESALGGTKWDVIYLSVGYDGITDFSEQGLQKFDADITALVTTLKNTGAKLMWGTQAPFPTAWFGQLDNEKIYLLNQRVKKIMEANSVLVNDTYGFVMDKTPEYISQDKKELTLMNSDFFKAFTPKLVTTIVEALKFFGN